MTFVHGACKTGADAIADRLLREWGFADSIEQHPAEKHPTQDFGPMPGAGPRRNAYMVKLGAWLCLAFPCVRSKGTRGCIELAWTAMIPVRIFPMASGAAAAKRRP